MYLNADEIADVVMLTSVLLVINNKALRVFNLPSLQRLALELDQERNRIYKNAMGREGSQWANY